MADKSRTPGGRGEVWTGTYPALFQLRPIRYFRTTYSFIHSVRRIFASTSLVCGGLESADLPGGTEVPRMLKHAPLGFALIQAVQDLLAAV